MERAYVEAARVLGLRSRNIFLSHVVPNALSVVIVNLALTMSGAILLEAALSYLGVRPLPPAPSCFLTAEHISIRRGGTAYFWVSPLRALCLRSTSRQTREEMLSTRETIDTPELWMR